MSNTKRKPVRNGRSLTLNHSNVPEKQLMDFGLSEAAVKRAMRVRNKFPYKEDPTEPCIDGRSLWSNIGKPHKQFHVWADHYLKPLVNAKPANVEITTFEDSSKAGRPVRHYTLSRNLSLELAMQAKTPEGKEIRTYFLDMESIVFKLAEYNTSRAVVPVKLDNRLTHAAYKQNPKKAITIDIQFKSYLCKALTGLSTKDVVAKYGERIRDLLKSRIEKLDVYNEGYTMAVAMYESGKRWAADIEPLLKQVYGGKIDLEKLLAPQQ